MKPILTTIVCASIVTVAFAQPGQQQQPPPNGNMSQLIKVPPNATLIGQSEIDEIRSLPEMSDKLNRQKAQASKVVGIRAVDRLYQTDKLYTDTVKYFDNQFKLGGYTPQGRTIADNWTAWTVVRPDGTVANVVVRNTKPTSFELIEGSGAAAEIQGR